MKNITKTAIAAATVLAGLGVAAGPAFASQPSVPLKPGLTVVGCNLEGTVKPVPGTVCNGSLRMPDASPKEEGGFDIEYKNTGNVPLTISAKQVAEPGLVAPWASLNPAWFTPGIGELYITLPPYTKDIPVKTIAPGQTAYLLVTITPYNSSQFPVWADNYALILKSTGEDKSKQVVATKQVSITFCLSGGTACPISDSAGPAH